MLFDLGDNNIDDDGAEAIADALKANDQLQDLNLSCNNIDDDGDNKALKQFDLQNSASTLHVACSTGDAARVRQLITMGADVNSVDEVKQIYQSPSVLYPISYLLSID